MAGSGAYWARAEETLDAVVRAAKIPVYLNGMARGMLGAKHPYQVYGNRKEALRGADVVVLLGVDFDFRLGFGQGGTIHKDAVIIQVDTDAARIGRNRAATIGVVADINQFLRCLQYNEAAYGHQEPIAWTHTLRQKDQARLERDGDAIPLSGSPVHPRQFVRAVTQFLDEDATVIGDGGGTSWPCLPPALGRADPDAGWTLGHSAVWALAHLLQSVHDYIGRQRRLPLSSVTVHSVSMGLNTNSAVRQRLPFVGIIGNDGAWGEMRTFHEDVFGSADLRGQYLSQSTAYKRSLKGSVAMGSGSKMPVRSYRR